MTSVEPLDSGQIAFALSFNGQEFEIDPPIGWDSMKIGIKRGEKYARHIDMAISDIEFWNRPIEFGHQFDRLIQAHESTADESKIELIIYIDSVEWLRSEFVMSDCITDRENYFKTKLKGSNLRQLIESRKDVKVSVFGVDTPDGGVTAPAPTQLINLDPKIIRTTSQHTAGNIALKPVNIPVVLNIGGQNTTFPGGLLAINNPWGALSIEQSDEAMAYYVPTNQVYVNAGPGNNIPTTYTNGMLSGTENFWIVEQSNIKINISDLSVAVNLFGGVSPQINIIVQMVVITYDNEQRDNIVSSSYTNLFSAINTPTATIDTDWSGVIPAFSRLIFEIRVNSSGFQPRRINDNVTITGGKFTTEIINIFDSSQVEMVRLHDAGKRVIDSISENTAISDLNPISGDTLYWNSFVISGSRLRGFQDSDFNLSYSDFKKFIQNAFNGDIQINDNELFLGKYADFYTDVEIMRIPFKPSVDSFEISLNKDLIKNELLFGFETFEKDENNTLDAFHTNSEWYIRKRNAGKIESKINFILDGYSIEYARRQGISKEPTTAKDKDDKTYLIDCVFRGNKMSNRQNQGFSTVDGIYSPESAYNLLYQIKRLLIDNYSERLAELAQVMNNGTPSTMIEIAKLTDFKANSDLETVANILGTSTKTLKDSDNIVVNVLDGKPKITPFIYKFEIAMRFKFINLLDLCKRIVNDRGYITFFTDETEIKVYPFNLDYDWNKEILTLTTEQRYED